MRQARRWLFRGVILAAVGWMGSTPAHGIQRGYGSRPELRQSAGVTLSLTEFAPTAPICAVNVPDGGCELLQDYSFDHPILGLFYARPGIQVFVSRGTQDGSAGGIGDLKLLETLINLFGAVRPFRRNSDRAVTLVFPYGLHSGYRRISTQVQSTSVDQFEATVMAVGLGVGIVREGGPLQFSARAVPFFGLASRSLGFGNGTSSMVDTDAEVSLGPVSGRMGVVVGYRFRWQRWNMGKDFGSSQDFKGTQHGFRVGVSW